MNKSVFLFLFISNYVWSQSCTSNSIYATWQAPTVVGQAGELTTSDVQTSQSIIVEGIVQGCFYGFSTCGSSLNTSLTGYNGSNPVFFNDQNGPFCNGTVASVQWVATFNGNLEVKICGSSSGVNCDFSLQLHECNTVEIYENKFVQDEFISFPNPVSKDLTFSTSNKYSDVTITITNFQGELVNTVKVDDSIVKIDFNDKSSGLYFYTIALGNQIIQTGKFIKQ